MNTSRNYRLNCLHEDGKVSHILVFFAMDDLDALDIALRHCEDHMVEVWHHRRLVARLLKGCEAA